MAQVFISYSRKDLQFVQQFAQTLMSNGVDVWWDLSSLQGGDNWTNEIPQAIDNCDSCIVVLSPNSVESEWVQKEYTYALKRKKRIIPLLYQSCDIPFALINVNPVDLQGHNYEKGLHEIVRLSKMGSQGKQQVFQPSVNVNNTVNPVLLNNYPTGVFNNIWFEHNIIWGIFFGMRIHASVSISGQRNSQCKLVAHFFGMNGQLLRDFNFNPFYRTVDGFVTTIVDMIPLYDEVNYPDIVMYIPYNELHLMPGVHQLTCRLSLWDVARNSFFAQSFFQPFIVTQQ
jgi:hypothetical protein